MTKNWKPVQVDCEGVLSSPTGQYYQHQGQVVVHARPSEDGPVTEVVIQTNGDISTRQPPPEDWISKRCNGLAIQFREEGPRAPSYWLRIYQHKGVTYIEWSEDE